ncbi:Dus-domain-containing protein, partial [Atractiella rhizophila]
MEPAQADPEPSSTAPTPKYYDARPGIAAIKSEFVRWDLLPSASSSDPTAGLRSVDDDAAEAGERPAKKPRLEGDGLKREDARDARDDRGKGGKKKQRGMNKARKFGIREITQMENPIKLCNAVARSGICEKGDSCKFSHSLKEFLQHQPQDITPVIPSESANTELPKVLNICPLFSALGKCPFGFRCRFLASHLRRVGEGEGFMGSGLELVVDQEKFAAATQDGKITERGELNDVGGDTIRKIRSKKYPIPRTEEFFRVLGEPLDQRQSAKGKEKYSYVSKAEEGNASSTVDPPVSTSTDPTDAVPMDVSESRPASRLDKDSPVDLTRLRPTEKKRLDLRGERYLAPLTTVGNLPFRRLCVQLGATVTCSEMGLAQEFLTGNPGEWSLVRRHPSEKIFGVQICGGRPQVLAPACEAIVGECNIDFMDLNTGCPIDLVFQKGAGSALLEHPTRLGKCLMSMNKALGDVPLTLKMRTGVKDSVRVAHKLMLRSQSEEWGPQVITLHGRS